ncbi:hypothetical protein B1218_36300, partial [Pseudomonas ogarae]
MAGDRSSRGRAACGRHRGHRRGAAGTGPGVPVGSRFARGGAAIVAMLAGLEAGGAYVPSDPTYPADRRGCMLAEDAIARIVVGAELDDSGPANREGFVLDDRTAPDLGDWPTRPLPAANDLAYLIYTSGST